MSKPTPDIETTEMVAAALRPFAAIADIIDEECLGLADDDGYYGLRVGDFRAARSALDAAEQRASSERAAGRAEMASEVSRIINGWIAQYGDGPRLEHVSPTKYARDALLDVHQAIRALQNGGGDA